jgi:hypothetical protein
MYHRPLKECWCATPTMQTLQFDNVMAAHAVSQFSTSGQEGFEAEDGFKLSSDTAKVAVDRSLDTVTKEAATRCTPQTMCLE